MSALLDTSVVVRYLTGDPPDLASYSARVIDGEPDLLITDVVIAETAYVLSSVYGISRAAVVDRLIRFLRRENVDTFRLPKETVILALLLCRPSGRVSFADALTWAVARVADTPIHSLDARFPGEGVTLLPRDAPPPQ